MSKYKNTNKNTKLCPHCGKFVSDTKFCQSCGYNLEVEECIETPTCPECRKTFSAGTKFCDVDGAKLVSPESLIPRCVKCGKIYTDGTKFCPDDGGQILAGAYIKSNSSSNPSNFTSVTLNWKNQKTLGLMFAIFGGIVFIGSLIAKNSDQYRVGRFFGAGKGFTTTVDIFFFLSICVLLLGIVLLIVGNSKNANNK